MKAMNFLFLAIACVGTSCQSSTKTNKELFDITYEVNVKACVDAMVNNGYTDTLKAESICSCLLNNLFLLDSTFVQQPADSLMILLEKNRKALEDLCEK